MALHPEYPDAIHNLGLLYGNAGNLDKAMSVWEQALALDPKDKVAQENIKRIRQTIEKQK
jgi:lipoprotein NlpI